MIFITLGSQKFQFNRLLKEIDRLIENGVITDIVFAQIGNSDYEPHHYDYARFLSRQEFSDMQAKCDIVITHGGTGAIIGALKKNKKVIAVPRLAKFGEHVDDHQLQLLHQFDDMQLIETCYDITELEKALKKVNQTEYKKYVSNTMAVVESIDNIITEDIVVGKNKHRLFRTKLFKVL